MYIKLWKCQCSVKFAAGNAEVIQILYLCTYRVSRKSMLFIEGVTRLIIFDLFSILWNSWKNKSKSVYRVLSTNVIPYFKIPISVVLTMYIILARASAHKFLLRDLVVPEPPFASTYGCLRQMLWNVEIMAMRWPITLPSDDVD